MQTPKKKLVIGIDASRSTHLQPTGVERYSTEIISALLREPSLEESSFRLYTPRKISHFLDSSQRVLWGPRLWTLVRLSIEMFLDKPDILFVPAHVLPFFAPRRSFVMIHDLAFEKIPEVYSLFQRWYLRWSTRRALKRCERVLVPSQAVAEDLKKIFAARPEQILVIHHGPLLLETLKEKAPPSKDPLFFYLGRLEAKKNLSILAQAFQKVREKHPHARLVLAGRPGHGWDSIKTLLQNQPGIELPGFMKEKDVSSYFARATAFVFPSLEEGFGFPLLQAFQAGCPVLCSDIPVLREIGGDASLYVSPQDIDGFSKAMLRLIEEPELASVLTLKGYQRYSTFSWEKASRALADLFSNS